MILNRNIEINCDLGEVSFDQIKTLDAVLMPYIDACNIACGGHAGDAHTISAVIDLANLHQVKIGAHPSFIDKENFGRKAQDIPDQQLAIDLKEQLKLFKSIAKEKNSKVHHVKAHGALYNLIADDQNMAEVFCEAVAQCFEKVTIYGRSQSLLSKVARKFDLKFYHEAFTDRKYEADLSLRSRTHEDAVLDVGDSIQQFILISNKSQVSTTDNRFKNLLADTLCIHSDSPNAIALAKMISELKTEIL